MPSLASEVRVRVMLAGRSQAGGSDPASSELVQSLRCKGGGLGWAVERDDLPKKSDAGGFGVSHLLTSRSFAASALLLAANPRVAGMEQPDVC